MQFHRPVLSIPQTSRAGGFSLVETVAYIAIFVTLSIVLTGTLFGMFRAYTALRANNDLLDSAHVSMERISREMRNATSVELGASVLDLSPGKLVLDAKDAAGMPKTVTFDVTSDGALEMLDSTDGTPHGLSGSKVRVSSLMFQSVTTARGSAVRVVLTLSSLRVPSARPVVLEDTLVLRGSYSL